MLKIYLFLEYLFIHEIGFLFVKMMDRKAIGQYICLIVFHYSLFFQESSSPGKPGTTADEQNIRSWEETALLFGQMIVHHQIRCQNMAVSLESALEYLVLIDAQHIDKAHVIVLAHVLIEEQVYLAHLEIIVFQDVGQEITDDLVVHGDNTVLKLPHVVIVDVLVVHSHDIGKSANCQI